MDSLKTEKIRLTKQADVFIMKTATQTLTSPQVVEKVMGSYFRELLKAFRIYDSIEMSGFGTFKLSQNKLSRKIKELELTKERIAKNLEKGKYAKNPDYARFQMEGISRDIEHLKSRKTTDETKLEGHYRRMAESFNASREIERDDSADERSQTGDL